MPDRKPPSTIGKDILFITGFILLFLGVGGWLVFSLINSWSESPVETESGREEVTWDEQPGKAPSAVSSKPIVAEDTSLVGSGLDSQQNESRAIRSLTENLLEIPDPLLAEALQNASSFEYKIVNAALNQLKKYPENREAFDALVKLASSHREANIRFYATGALTRFDSFDLREFCEGRLKRDPDYRVAQTAINLAVRQKFPGFEEVLLLGCRSRHPQVREWAAGALGSNKIARGSSTLLNLAQRDAEKKVRQIALRALSELHDYKALSVVKNLLRSPEKDDKWMALNTLRLWQSNPDALDLLEPYRNDPLIGKPVANHLARYGR